VIARSVVLGLAAAVLLPLGGAAYRKTEQGNERYREGRYEEALRLYTEAQLVVPDSPELHYDVGNVLYRLGDLEAATEAFARALQSGPAPLEQDAAYNLGNTLYRKQAYALAVKAFERALRLDPDGADAKRNLEIALLALQRQQPEGERGDEEEQPEEDPQPEDEPEEETPTSDPEKEEEQGRPTEETPQMTPLQAERMLDGLEEQELENLRRQALREPLEPRTTTEEDW
jgi:Ca-activated chloride channel family protein